jgi:2-keto-3-deoxy-L-rhamnonate aldolase RhmA
VIYAQQLREKISSGKPVFGTFLAELKAAGVVQILANSEFDFIAIDGEHGAYSIERICALIASSHAAEITVLVRLPLDDRGRVTQVLDAGADGIIFPQICSMDEVRLAVEMTKYPPVGRRGVHMLRPHTQFQPPADSFDYMESANRTLLTAVQIETPQAAAMVEEIAATDGVDMLYIGPVDLKTNLNFCNGDNADEKLKQCSEQTAKACKKHGKIAGHHCRIEEIASLHRLGFSVLGYAAAARLLATGAEDFIKRAGKAISDSQDANAS